MSIRRSTAVFAVVLAAVVTACGEKKIEKAELEQKVKASLTAKVRQKPKAIRCPGDISAEVGAKTRCILVATDGELDVDVRVSSVEGDKYNLDIKAGTEVRR